MFVSISAIKRNFYVFSLSIVESSIPAAVAEVVKIDTKNVTKRKVAAKTKETDAADGIVDSKNVTKRKVAEKPAKMNKMDTDYGSVNFAHEKDHNYKISSWNVAGLRAWVGKSGLELLQHEKPDILCLQETKCTEDQLPEAAKAKGYHTYWHCKPGGRDGVALYSKTMPYDVKYGMGSDEMDAEARMITAEYSRFYLICVYVPNAGRGLVNLQKRMRWDELFRKYVKQLDAKKPVIVCGDMNVAHEAIDLANPKTNTKNAGFTPEEREGMSKLLAEGFLDSFRALYPQTEKAYTFWTYMGGARAKNVGWRLDYFILSERLQPKVVDNVMRSECMGSDHCPITLFLNFWSVIC